LLHSRTSRKGLVVPVAAVLRDDENLPFLYVAMPDGSFARRRISLGGRFANGYEVTSGVAAGGRIVEGGSLYLSTLGHQGHGTPSSIPRWSPSWRAGTRSFTTSSAPPLPSRCLRSWRGSQSLGSASGRFAGSRSTPIPISRHRRSRSYRSGRAT